jgi:O-glycosyl hydrolase
MNNARRLIRKLVFTAIAAFVFSCALPQDQAVRVIIQPLEKFQVIENFGASGCWFSEGIGSSWPTASKDSIAALLFSRKQKSDGQPEGIGLSAWRFNIGGGTAEQGSGSGIKTSVKRVEGFVDSLGRYDWTKQPGYQWFLRKAKSYGITQLIAFSNTPPVHFTKNGLGFRTEKDYVTNLREDRYVAYADFLGTVAEHFDREGLPFSHISPVNEPQWDWSNKFGEMNQEGSPWHNKDIYRITASLDSVITKRRLKTKIIIPEAATLKYLYGEGGHAGKQIQHFFGSASPLNVRKFKNVYPVVVGHSYFTDAGDSNRNAIRTALRDTAVQYGVPFWQSEYSMLGNGYKEGKSGRIPAMDCALFLAKMIHTDLTIANATAWQLWNVYEPGSADFDTRYYLIALKTNDSNSTGTFKTTKNLWAMGHYSLFIRPGMQRVGVEVSAINDAKIFASAYTGKDGKVVLVLINYSETDRTIDARQQNKSVVQTYLTTAESTINMKPVKTTNLSQVNLPARSIMTITLKS